MAKFFINRPIVAIVISILTVIAGVLAMTKLPIAQLPDIVPPQVNVAATYTGADALTIEQSVATPLEQQMNGVDNMLYLQSTNANDGSLIQTVTFATGTNPDIANVLVQNRYSQAQASLPQEVKNFGVTIKKKLPFPLLVFSLFSPDNRYDAQFLGNYATINIIDALKRIPGVGDVVLFGSSDYAMRIWVDPRLLTRFNLTITEIESAIRAQNVVNPAGQIGAEPGPPGKRFTYSVRAQGRLVTPEEFGDIVVRARPDGSQIRLKDVARVELGALSYQQEGRYNGRPGGVIAVFQSPGSNALKVGDGLKAAMADLRNDFPPGLEYAVALDTTLPIVEGMREIGKTFLQALALVFIVVFVFLQSWRATLIPLLGVPVALVGTFAVFPLLGFSLNTLSLFGLILAIGVVVDDGIVVVEAVQYHIDRGLPPRDATLKAMSEVAGPVVGITVVLVAVFVPMAFVPGITGRLYQQFALTIAVSVLISAFNALTFAPALSALLLRSSEGRKGFGARLGARFNAGFDRLTRGYVRVGGALIRRVALSLGLLGATAIGAAVIGSRIPTGFVPEEDQGYCLAGFQLPDASSLERTREVGTKIEEVLAKTPGIRSYTVIAGYNLLTNTSTTYTGTVFVAFEDWARRTRESESAEGIVRSLNIAFSRIPEARALAYPPPAIPGIGTAGGANMMIQDRSGKPIEFLAQNVGKFLSAARERPEFQAVTANFSPAVPQLFVEVDKDKVLKQGVALTDVYETMQVFLGGRYVNDFTRFGRQWRVFLQSEGEARVKPEDIERFFVRNARGTMVPLSTLVTVKNVSGPEYTIRFNLYRSAEVLGTVAPGFSSGQALKAFEEVAAQTLPPGMGYAWTNLSYQEKGAEGGTLAVFGLALLFVFLILAALYESWSLPFSVLLGTPIAVLGAFLGLLGREFDFDVYGQIGLVMLIGLAAKNAILIVEFAKLQVEKGAPLIEAALEGARLRLRPILMTSFAFVFGCVPLWLATGGGAASRRILGTTVVAGALAATVLATFLIPVLFVVVERVTGGRRQQDPSEPARTERSTEQPKTV
ncbi:MAG TPA: multidrug efflux RND transporter permease subunit [Myxococcota bacterium]|nr:multidrug efflux RND transporter permease subunit [Myxococcota bacterium]